mmetsp:Transcript_57088/g.134374  ORF Transcript_57088/g.134374 Transcript_57088/m.134374 type:complete len:248 (+) Transcript_57088:528-1271(+)
MSAATTAVEAALGSKPCSKVCSDFCRCVFEPDPFQSWQALLRDNLLRAIYAQRNGIDMLLPILRNPNPNKNLQVIYQVCHCMWLLSYHKEVADRMVDISLLQPMLNLLKVVVKEKVIRMVLATFRNLLVLEEAKSNLVDLGCLKVIDNLTTRNFSDDELQEDANAIREELEGVIQTKSTFHEYVKEVLSGELEWSPVHRSQKFWENNYHKFTDKDNQVLTVLGLVLRPSERPNHRAIAGLTSLFSRP